MAVALQKELAKALVQQVSVRKAREEAGRRRDLKTKLKLAETIEKELVWGLDDEDVEELNGKLSVNSVTHAITEKILGRESKEGVKKAILNQNKEQDSD